MTDHTPQHDQHQDEPALPVALAALLREHAGADRPLQQGEPTVERRIDDAVMREATLRLGEIEPPRPLKFPMTARVIGGLGLAAAAIGLVVYFGPAQNAQTQHPTPSDTEEVEQLALEDGAKEFDRLASSPRAAKSAESATLDSVMGVAPSAAESRSTTALAFAEPSGDGTIRDAYRLALALEAGQPVSDGWDTNADGEINQQDVDAMARNAVDLGDRLSHSAPIFSPTFGFALPFFIFDGGLAL